MRCERTPRRVEPGRVTIHFDTEDLVAGMIACAERRGVKLPPGRRVSARGIPPPTLTLDVVEVPDDDELPGLTIRHVVPAEVTPNTLSDMVDTVTTNLKKPPGVVYLDTLCAMTPDEFAAAIRECVEGDTETRHVEADELMCRVLRSLGYGAGVEIFEDMVKWYA